MSASRQKVSAVLRKAGFRPSVGRSSRIRGWKNYSPGYDLYQRHDGIITVRYRSDWVRDENTMKAWADKYLLVLGPIGGVLNGVEVILNPPTP